MKRKDFYIRDPFLLVEDGVGYLVGTTDETAWSGPADGFLGYRTTDLENFDGPFRLFSAGDGFWSREHFWAPELHKVGEQYCLVASFKSDTRRRACQILTSKTPLGEYRPTASPFTPPEWECLDATLWEEDGILYTVFCHEWQQCYNGEICLARLNATLDGIEGEPRVLFRATDAPWVVYHDGGGYITDGPFIHRLKSGKLLMLWSSVGKKGYAVGMAVSEKGIKGPWRQIEEPLFEENGGHAMAFTFGGKLYVALHCPNDPHLEERCAFFEAEEREDRIVLKNTGR